MSSEGIIRNKRKKINIGKYPRSVRQELYSAEYKDMRDAAEAKISDLDKQIDLYVQELMDIMMPQNIDTLEDRTAKKMISTSVYLSVYKQKLDSLFYDINNGKHYSHADILNFDIKKDDVAIKGAEKVAKYSRYKKRYKVKPTSLDLGRMVDCMLMGKEYIENRDKISPSQLKNYLSDYPHIRIMTELKKFLNYGGKFTHLDLKTCDFANAEATVQYLRKILIEKTMIADNRIYEFFGRNRLNMFNENEKLYLNLSFLSSMDKLRRIVGMARLQLDLDYLASHGDSNRFIETATYLNSNRLYRYAMNESTRDETTTNIVNDAVQTTKPLVPVSTEEKRNSHPRRRMNYFSTQIKSEEEIRQQHKKEIESGIAAIGGMAAILAFAGLLAMAVDAEFEKKSDPTQWDASNRIYEKGPSGSRTTINHDEFEIMDREGNPVRIQLTADTIRIIDSAIENNYLENQKAEMELRGEMPKIEHNETQEHQTATRRRRVDKYKNIDSDYINL